MKIRIINILMIYVAIVSATGLFAQTKISPRSLFTLQQVQNSQEKVPCFIKIENTEVLEELKNQGVEINYVFGDIVTAIIPISKVKSVARIAKVQRLQIAQKMSLCNDKGREFCKVEEVHQGEGLDMPYTGKGVVIGMVDVGIDFNHIGFKDSDGNSRVKGVYMPCDESGNKPNIAGNELPGSGYYEADEIASLTSDCRNESHGTHTTTTAAGSYKGNNFYGVAPETDIVLAAMPEDKLSDVNIANSVAFIFERASQLNKPAVINMSLSSHEGPHDGTSMLSQAISQITGNGKMCVVSVGNDAGQSIKVQKKFEVSSDTLRTFFEHWRDLYAPKCSLDMWADNDKKFGTQVVVYDKSSNSIAYHTPWYIASDREDNELKIEVAQIDYLRQYISGSITFSSGIGINDKMEMCLYLDLERNEGVAGEVPYYIGVRCSAEQGTTLTGWVDPRTPLVSNGVDGWQYGTDNGNISDFCTGKGVISVGASCSKNIVPQIEGNGIYNRSELGDIAYFSSYGKDMNGENQPMVVAPGYAVVSAMNRYDETLTESSMSFKESVEGNDYYWGTMYGTSQSAPMVTGAIALWLQANPELTADDVKQILEDSCDRDEHVINGNQEKWGYGKLNALAGLQVAANTGVNNAEKEKLWSLTVSDDNLIIITPEDGDVTVNIYNISGVKVAECKAEAVGAMAQINLGDAMRGAYVVEASTATYSHKFKMIIK